MNDQEEENKGAEDGHAAAVPLAAPVAEAYLVTRPALLPVLCLHHIALNDMQDKARKQTELQQPDHQRGTHEMRRPVEHGSVIRRIEPLQVIKDTGVQTYVNDQERNKKQTRERHYQFSANCGGKEVGPLHMEMKIMCKVTTRSRKKRRENEEQERRQSSDLSRQPCPQTPVPKTSSNIEISYWQPATTRVNFASV